MSIYLDNAATTRISPEALEAMTPYLTEEYGNAGSLYGLGRRAAKAIQRAREQAALLFGCTAEHVVFTSGGSESNSTVFAGIRTRLLDGGKTHLVISAIEHDSVLKAAQALAKDGFDITIIYPGTNGHISRKKVEDAIREDTGLVSVMFVNNETGVVNDVWGIGQVCRERSVLFHMDCVQAAGLYELPAKDCADFASVSSHKIHGPKGVGALYLRDKNLSPLISGGAEQEFGLRGGTENVAGIVGFGRSCEDAVRNLQEDAAHISAMRQRFFMTLRRKLEEKGVDKSAIHINGLSAITPGKVLNLRIDGVDGETLLLMLDSEGVCASAGSACRSHETKPSHVLTAMGLSRDEARSSIRISFSKYNTPEEVEEAASIFAHCISVLKKGQQNE